MNKLILLNKMVVDMVVFIFLAESILILIDFFFVLLYLIGFVVFVLFFLFVLIINISMYLNF